MIGYRCTRLVLGIGLLLTSGALLAAQQPGEGMGEKPAMPADVAVPVRAVVGGGAVLAADPAFANPGDDKGGTGEAPPVKTRVQRYVEVLKSDQEPVRKWAIKVIVGMGPEGLEAIPAILEVAGSDPSPAIKQQARAVAKTYKAVDLAEQLSKVLRNSKANPEWRRIACVMLPRLHRDAPLETALKEDVRKALEQAIADEDPDIQIAAARALDEIESGAPTGRRQVHLEFDMVRLKGLRLTVAEVAKAIQQQNPDLQAHQIGTTPTIECTIRNLDDAMFLDRFVLPGDLNMRLKAVCTPKAPPAQAPAEEEKKEPRQSRRVRLEFDLELLEMAKVSLADVLKALQEANPNLKAQQVGQTIECSLGSADDARFLARFMLPAPAQKLRLLAVAQIKDVPPPEKNEDKKGPDR